MLAWYAREATIWARPGTLAQASAPGGARAAGAGSAIAISRTTPALASAPGPATAR